MSTARTSLSTRPYPGLALISAGMLAFEIGLTRLFSVQQFHHFAFIVVSLALMGVAGGGLLLSLWPRHPPLASLATGYGLSVGLAYATVNLLPFDSYSIAWDRSQAWILLLYFLVSGLPFLFAGWAAGAALAAAGQRAHLPYAAVFVGSGLGAPLALTAHALWGEVGVIATAAGLGMLGAAAFSRRPAGRILALVTAAFALWLGASSPPALSLELSTYKPLRQIQRAPDAETTITAWSASERLDVVETGSVHVFPGLSLNAVGPVPDQSAAFLDGDGPIPLMLVDLDGSPARQVLGRMPSALAYQLRPAGSSLILNPGAGLNVMIALTNAEGPVEVATDQPLLFEVLRGAYAQRAGLVLRHPRVTVLPRSSRGTLQGGEAGYAIVEFALSDPFRPVTSGAFSLSEDFLLTREAFGAAYGRLDEDGLLVITRWLGTPPSESARAWSTLISALHDAGVGTPDTRLVAYRSMRTATLIAAARAFTQAELQHTRRFLHENAFDPIYLPDLRPEELNQYNRLPEPVYAHLFAELLNQPDETARQYDFRLIPPTDDRPYFHHFFRWEQTPEILATLGRTWQPFGGSGYFVLLALLALMSVLALPLMLLPVLRYRRNPQAPRPNARTLAYFASLGGAYLLVEIPFIQRFILLLDRPALSLALVLFTLLLASGVGSFLSKRIALGTALSVLVALVLALILILPPVVEAALPWPMVGRAALGVGFLMPLGLLMGVPFASGLRRLERRSPGLIPWAWAINGAASGVTGVLAALVALDWGFQVVLILGALAYLSAFVTMPPR